MEILLAALLGGFLLFNSAATPEKAEKIIESALRKTYPRATVNAEVEGKRGRAVLKGNFRRVRLELTGIGDVDGLPFSLAREDAKAGHLGRLEMALRDFRFNELPVENAEFTFNKVAYDRDALKKTSKLMFVNAGPASAQLTVGAPALETVFENSLKGVRDVKIKMRDGRIIMDAKKVVPLIDVGVPFTFTAKPEPRGNEIWLTDGRIAMENVTGFTLPVKNLLGDLNPIFTFDRDQKWPFRVNLTGVGAQNDKLDIVASLTFVGGSAAPTGH